MNKVRAEGVYLIGKMNTFSREAYGQEINVFSNSKEASYLPLREIHSGKKNCFVVSVQVPPRETHEEKRQRCLHEALLGTFKCPAAE